MKSQPIEHVAYDPESHGAIQTTNFDYAAVDGEAERPDPMALAADGFGQFLAWIWQTKGSEPDFGAAFTKFCAVSAVVSPELLSNMGLKEIGQRIGRTKAALSKWGVRFGREFGPHFRRQHNGQANMSLAMKQSHEKRKQKHDALTDPHPTH
jgi:hypothetical protein